MIDRQIGRTLRSLPQKSRRTTFGAAQVLTVALTVGFAAFCGAVTLLLIMIM